MEEWFLFPPHLSSLVIHAAWNLPPPLISLTPRCPTCDKRPKEAPEWFWSWRVTCYFRGHFGTFVTQFDVQQNARLLTANGTSLTIGLQSHLHLNAWSPTQKVRTLPRISKMYCKHASHLCCQISNTGVFPKCVFCAGWRAFGNTEMWMRTKWQHKRYVGLLRFSKTYGTACVFCAGCHVFRNAA